jgi:ubiquinone/menaquinone biosynthesis C-methylase UbiE
MSDKKDKPMPNIMFRFMAWGFKWRDRYRNPAKKRLDRLGIKEGQTVLDFGCGIGSFSIPAARLVGERGKVYALDIHPLAIEAVEKKVRKEGLNNIEIIHSDRDTGLADESVDVILPYTVLHEVKDKQALLEELHRVLKPDGFLSAYEPHIKADKVLQIVEENGLFSLKEQDKGLLNFKKLESKA